MNPIVIMLPEGTTIGGVTTWAYTLAEVLSNRGWPITLVVHGGTPGHDEVECAPPPGCEVVNLNDLRPPRTYNGDLSRVIEAYKTITEAVSERTGQDAILLPTRDADCFAACAEVCMQTGARLVGWRHSPMPYEQAIFERYSWAMSRIVGVSAWLCASMQRDLPNERDRVGLVINGVAVPPVVAQRPHSDAIRLIYTGRLDEPVKRVSSLIAMSDALNQHSIEHVLTIVGDGPATQALQVSASQRPSVRLLGAIPPSEVSTQLDRHDVFVLGSRIEGLSLAALEAMAHGCALVISDTPSGAQDLVGHGEAGEIASCSAINDAETVGCALADSVKRVIDRGVAKVGSAAHARAQRLFSHAAMGDAAERELIIAAQSERPPRRVVEPFHDVNRPGSVPPDARARFSRALAEHGADRIIIHGLGAHTTWLAEEIDSCGGAIVAFTDDDPSQHGRMIMGRPVIPPSEAAQSGAGVVVISSWLHETTIWDRRSQYEQQGLRVVRLYGETPGQAA